MSTRKTAVAGQFYPSDPQEIRKVFDHYNQILEKHFSKDDVIWQLRPRAVIVPHAGYIYSGFTANIALKVLTNQDIDHIVIIGPSHRVYFKGTSISECDKYHTPLGDLPIDRKLACELKEEFALEYFPDAHHEHSTEVQFPFIKAYKPNVAVEEIVYSDEDPEKLAPVIKRLLQDPKTAIVISTDLSHYYDIQKANRLDSICLEAVKELDRGKLHDGCEACGKIGVEAMMIAAKELRLESVVLDYRTSADASGDESQVVGYMSAAFVESK
ncbi:MAG: AmmeMemoRadiSam system protein B [Sulfurimonas sp.]